MNNTLKQTAATPLTSLNSESTTIGDRLNNILDRITAIGVSLYGPVPRDVGPPAIVSTPLTNLALNIERAHRVLGEIEGELSLIESRL